MNLIRFKCWNPGLGANDFNYSQAYSDSYIVRCTCCLFGPQGQKLFDQMKRFVCCNGHINWISFIHKTFFFSSFQHIRSTSLSLSSVCQIIICYNQKHFFKNVFNIFDCNGKSGKQNNKNTTQKLKPKPISTADIFPQSFFFSLNNELEKVKA